MTTIGRNDPCHCGSGKRFKRCHGSLARDDLVTIDDATKARVFAQFERMEAERRAYIQQFGETRPPLTAVVGDHRIVVVNDGFIPMPASGSGYPTDFFREHAISVLGKKWWLHQRTLPPDARVPIVSWENSIYLQRKAAAEAGNQGDVELASTGAMLAFLRLARDLFTIRDNAEFERKVLNRLRLRDQFQGARFELAVAAAFLTAGRKIAYPKQSDDKTPDLISQHIEGGADGLSIEAKSKHRNGILGFRGGAEDSTYLGIHSILNKALKKGRLDQPLLVFIELNLSDVTTDQIEATRREVMNLMAINEREYPQGYPASAAFFFNDSTPHHLDEPFDGPRLGRSAWAFTYRPQNAIVELSDGAIALRLQDALMQRAMIPSRWQIER